MQKDVKWKMSPAEVLHDGPVIPVIVINQLEHAVPLAEALLAGGVRVLEVTLRTPAALDAIKMISSRLPDAIVGAGTVTNARELQSVQDAGGMFAISPGITPCLLDASLHGSIPLIPGIATASELMVGMENGFDHFKFFPAEAAGGIKMLKSLAGPFPDMTFCPTGGISMNNYRDYLSLASVACVGGSWLAPADAVTHGEWNRIADIASNAISIQQ